MAEWLKSHTNEKQVNDWLLVFNMNANIKSISNDSDDKLITKASLGDVATEYGGHVWSDARSGRQ